MNSENKTANVFTGRNFRLVFFGALVSELGAVLYSFAVSFYILEISGNNAFLQGLYLALCGIMQLLLTPVGGVLGDRFNKAAIMYACDYIKGGIIVLATLLMLVFPAGGAHIAILFAVGILGNMVSGIFNPAAGALLPYIVEEDRLQQANAYFSVKSSLESIFGIVLAGVLYALLPITLLFFIVGVCYILSAVSETFIRYRRGDRAEKLSLRGALSDMGEGLRYLRSQRAIMAMMISILFVNFFIAPIWGNFLPYFVKTDVAAAPSYLFDRFLTPELWTSVFSVLTGVSSLAGSVILSARPQAEKCGSLITRLLCAVAVVVMAFAAGYWILVARGVSLNVFLLLFCLGCLLVGFLVTYINIPFNTAVMRVIDRSQLSRVSGIMSVMSQGLTPIASVLAGIVLQNLGSVWLLVLCAAGFTFTALRLVFRRETREI